MSNAVFPSLPGLSWGVKVSPTFKTKLQEAVSGAEYRASTMLYPKWKFQISFEFLRAGAEWPELQTLGGFFLARRGAYDSFLFSNPADNAVVDQQIGTGTGAAVAFQLYRTFGSGAATFIEPVQNVNAIAAIKVGGVVKTAGIDYTVNGSGLVTFTAAPANGAAITWTGSFYYRCRFLDDAAEFNGFMQDLWELKSCKFIGSPMNKV